MSKLFIFGIGGTGARVMRSFTMMLATGVDLGVETVIPILIDRDMSNADLIRTKSLIDSYIDISRQVPKPSEKLENKFFSTNIELINNNLCLELLDNSQIFSDYIRRDTMTKPNKALTDVLFSKDAQSMDMTQGFQGVPNIGSVVLNQFDDNEAFNNFAAKFHEGDKIFIISSIFGGTGASGFPLLLKTLRASKPEFNNWGYINSAPIGSISVLPYFGVSKTDDKNSRVDSDTFIDKSKAALSYYKTIDKQIDTLYYIGDNVRPIYQHHKGGKEQQNNASFVELAAAMAIVDFANNSQSKRNNYNEIMQTVYKEFGISLSEKFDTSGNKLINLGKNITFNDLSTETQAIIKQPFIRFITFRNYLKHVFPKEYQHQPWSHGYVWKKDAGFSPNFLEQPQMKQFTAFLELYYAWLKEMNEQERKFSPFKLKQSEYHGINFINNLPNLKKGTLHYKNWSWINNKLNKEYRKIPKELSKQAKFVELFHRVTQSFVNELIIE